MRDINSDTAGNVVVDAAVHHIGTRAPDMTANELAEICLDIDDSYARTTYIRRINTCKSLGYLRVVNPDEPGPDRFVPTDKAKERIKEIGLATEVDDRVDARPR